MGDSISEINDKLWPTLVANWKVWPLLQLINFALVPIKLQVLYVNFFGVFWNTYLSFQKFVNNPSAGDSNTVFLPGLVEGGSFEVKMEEHHLGQTAVSHP